MTTEILAGRHALVTGGGTGIGLAIATALAAAGAQVTITGRRTEVLKTAAGGNPRLHPQVMDVAEEASVEAGIAAAAAARGPVTICIANAGIAEGRAFDKVTLAEWRRTMAINLDGAFLTIRAVLPMMRAEGWGRVVAVSSMAGVKGLKGAPAYTASKHGLIGLIRGLAADYAGRGVTFNALCPAYVATAIVERNIENISARAGLSREKAREIMVGTNVHKRLIEPDEVAAAALWLCAPGSDSVNGQAIQIAGGEV